MNAPLVSIITLTYCHQDVIERCLRSVQAQSFTNWELLVVDDASPDRTADIVDRFAAADRRIRLIRHPSNYGGSLLAKTYNEALEQCSGELIAILEGDDEWASYKLSMQVPIFDDRSVVLCYGDYDEVTSDGVLVARHSTADAAAEERSGLRENLAFLATLRSFGALTVMARRAEVVNIGGFGDAGVPFVDYPTWLKLAVRGDFVRVPAVLGKWHRHRASLTYAHEYAAIERLRGYFVAYLTEAKEQLSSGGIGDAEANVLAHQASSAARQRQRSKPYFQGKYYLLFGSRIQAIRCFFQAAVHPQIALRHRLGALAGIVAAVTSPRLLPYLARITHSVG